MGLISNRVEKSDLRAGDHIYTYRNGGIYSHHGIFIGEDKVIHYTAIYNGYSGYISGSSHDHRSKVALISLDCFLGGGSLYRYEYGVNPFVLLVQRTGTCTIAPSDRPKIVVHRANYLLQKGFGYYNVFKNNCEDFALYCKTGLWIRDENRVGRSGQAWAATTVPGMAFIEGAYLLTSARVIIAAMSVGTSAAFLVAGATNVVIGVLGCVGVYLKSKYDADIGVRKDVFKVAVEALPWNIGDGEMDAENTKKMS